MFFAGERPACAPRLAASINPGPPPEITEKPASESMRAMISAFSKYGWPEWMRALPNIETAGRMPRSRSVAAANSAIIASTRHASRLSNAVVICGSTRSGIFLL